MMEIGDMAAGKAGEYLVCADLILAGHIAYPGEQGLPYDVIADVGGRLLKIQVKATRSRRKLAGKEQRKDAFIFNVRKCGKNGRSTYGEADVDIFAFVSLEEREIGYVSARDTRMTMEFRCASLRGQYPDEMGQVRSARVREKRAAGMTLEAIGAEEGLTKSAIGKILQSPGYKAGRYLADCHFETAIRRVTEAQA